MRLGCFAPGNDRRHFDALRAFAEGAALCGDEVFIAPVEQYRPCDVAVVFGVRKEAVPLSHPRGRIIAEHQGLGKRCVIIDSGYVKRDQYYMVGFDGLNGRADFRNAGAPDDRWRALQVELQPWREGGRHILLCGQIPWDGSVQHVDIFQWYFEAIADLRGVTDRPIRFRRHPLGPHQDPGGCDEYSEGTLAEDLADCWAVCTFNSNTAVDAVIAGVPAFSADIGSMARAVTRHDLREIERPIRPDRTAWAASLAYAQWALPELQSGACWRHLRPGAIS